jgi:hypothetical protein
MATSATFWVLRIASERANQYSKLALTGVVVKLDPAAPKA